MHAVPSDPKTPKQIAQRSKFGFVTSEMKCMRNLFKFTFGGIAGVNHGVSLAFGAVTGEYPDFIFDYSKLIISQGGLDIAGHATAVKTIGTTLKFDWDNTVGNQSTENDWVNIFLLNATTKVGLHKKGDMIRSQGTNEIELPAVWAGQSVHCWIFFTSTDGISISDSRYIDMVQL